MESASNCKKENQRLNEELVTASTSDTNHTPPRKCIPISSEATSLHSKSECRFINCEECLQTSRARYHLVKLSDIVKPDKKTKSPLTCSSLVPHVEHTTCPFLHSFHSENLNRLNRLFPSLKDELKQRRTEQLSYNKPNIMSLYDTDASNKTLINETTNDLGYSLIPKCFSSFCEDLLTMFLEQIGTDVFIETDGTRYGAHKSILTSRCQYFAGEFGVGFVESGRNIVILPDFCFKVVHFALCHIYSGVSDIPEYVNKLELARVANLLFLEELNDQIFLWYSGKYCHNFHEPCDICIEGVIKCLLTYMTPLGCGLRELSHKCFLWIVKYFYIVWPNKAFAKLPKLYIQKCYQRVISDISVENFLHVLNGCDEIVSSLPNEKWAKLIEHLCKKVIYGATEFATKWLDVTLIAVLTSPNIPTDASHPLTKCTYTAIEKAHPQQICGLYAHLSKLLIDCGWDLCGTSKSNSYDPRESYVKIEKIAYNWFIRCENALVRSATTTITTESFEILPEHLKAKLQTLGCIQRSISPTSTVDTGDTQVTQDEPVPEVRMTKTQLQRSNLNKRKNEEMQVQVASKLAKVINTKIRYLEPRARKDVVDESSSDSSPQSPVHQTAPRTSQTASTENDVTLQTIAACLINSQNNKYKTYTKYKQSDSQRTSTQSGSSNNSISWHGRTPTKISVAQCLKLDSSDLGSQDSPQYRTTQSQKRYKGKSSLKHPSKKSRI